MNKKLLAITMPLFGGALIVGAGFSAWAFNDDAVVTDQATVNPVVTDLLTGVTVKALYSWDASETTTPNIQWRELESFNLELDQGKLFDTTTLTIGVNPYVMASGQRRDIIQVAMQVYYTGTDDDGNDNLAAMLVDHNLTLSKFAVALTPTPTSSDSSSSAPTPHPLTTYVDMTSSTKAGFSGITAQTISTVPQTRPTTLLPTELDNDRGKLIYVTAGVDFDWMYNSGQKPGNISAYNTMKSAIEAAGSYTVDFSVDGAWSVKS